VTQCPRNPPEFQYSAPQAVEVGLAYAAASVRSTTPGRSALTSHYEYCRVTVRVRREGVVVLRVQVPPEEGVVHLGSYGSVRQG